MLVGPTGTTIFNYALAKCWPGVARALKQHVNDTHNLTMLRSDGSTLLETQPSTAIGAVPKSWPGDSMQFWTLERFALVLGLALLAAFPQIATGSHTFFYRDFGAMWYPVNVYTRDSFLSGEIPLWNPYIHCGVPFQAQIPAGKHVKIIYKDHNLSFGALLTAISLALCVFLWWKFPKISKPVVRSADF